MSYTKKVLSDDVKEIAELTKHYPRFADGRIDYTHAKVCFVVNCTVLYGDEVLLTFRNENVIAYPETWNGISGFVDEIQPLEKTIRDELQEEVGIVVEDIATISIRPLMVQIDHTINREWRVFPVLVELNHKPHIRTNWENKAAQWVSKKDVLGLPLMPFYAETFTQAIGGKHE